MKRTFIKISAIIFLGLFFDLSFANENDPFAQTLPAINLENNSLNPYIPHTYLSGYAGGGAANWLGQADILAPVFLRSDRNLFLYAQGRYADKLEENYDNTYLASFGAGYRQVLGLNLGEPQLFGLYVLADYMNSSYGNSFWNVTPGFEILGPIDFRLNGYFPVGTHKYEYTSYEFDHFAGNAEYDQVYKGFEETGIGGDAEVGMKIFSINHMPIKAYVNGYSFNTDDNGDVVGIGGRVTFQPTRYMTLELKDSYDNVQHNVFMGGIKFYLNAMSQGMNNTNVDNQSIQQRLYDPIENNFGGIGFASNMPENLSNVQNVGTAIVKDHIIFTELGSSATEGTMTTTGSGTYEDPYIYSGDMQTIMDNSYSQFPDYSYLYFSPGVYDMGTTAINIYSGQSIWGRSSDFVTPAADPTEVTFLGGYSAIDVNSLGFYDLQLLNNNGSFDIGLFIENTGAITSSNIIFDNVIIGEAPTAENANSTSESSFEIGISISTQNNTNVTFKDAEVYAKNSNPIPGGNAYSLQMIGGGTITEITDSIFYAQSIYASAFGIDFEGPSVIVGDITNSAFTGFPPAGKPGYGFFVSGDNVIIGNIIGTSFWGSTTSLYVNSDNLVSIGNITDSSFNGTYSGYGMYIASGSEVNIGNISGSDFSGENSGVDIVTDNNIEIGNITASTFQGYFDSGFSVTGNNVNIGNITGSSFAGPNGFYIDSNNSITIGEISGNTFESNNNNIYLLGDNITINELTYTDPEDLYTALHNLDNNFTTSHNFVCINSSCY